MKTSQSRGCSRAKAISCTIVAKSPSLRLKHYDYDDRVPYCGPVEIRFKNRRCFTGAMIMGDEPLIGAIPMEDMDLVVLPARQLVDVNPASPNVPMSLAK